MLYQDNHGLGSDDGKDHICGFNCLTHQNQRVLLQQINNDHLDNVWWIYCLLDTLNLSCSPGFPCSLPCDMLVAKTRCRDHEESLEETCRPQPASELELMYTWNISFVFYIIYIPDLCLFGFEFPIEWLALEWPLTWGCLPERCLWENHWWKPHRWWEWCDLPCLASMPLRTFTCA